MDAESLTEALRDAYWWFLGGGLFLGLIAETLVPLHPIGSDRTRARHVTRNVSIGLLARLFAGVGVGAWLLNIESRPVAPAWGLLHQTNLPFFVLLGIGVLLNDFGQYVLHRLMHRFRWLWILHAVHHSDTQVDVSTTLRFHPFEAATNLLWRMTFLAIMGLPNWVLASQMLLMVPVSLLQHANIRLPPSIDRALRTVIVTPGLHKIHHSPIAAENNSDFGEIFSFWDRIFGTLLDSPQEKSHPYGLPKLRAEGWQTLGGMLATPWTARRLPSL